MGVKRASRASREGLARVSGVAKELLVGEGAEAAVADDDVIEDADTDELADLFEAFGDGPIFGGRLGVTGGVVVDEHDRCGEDRGLEYFRAGAPARP